MRELDKPERTYTVGMSCNNCGHAFNQNIPYGEKVYPGSRLCPNCGVKGDMRSLGGPIVCGSMERRPYSGVTG